MGIISSRKRLAQMAGGFAAFKAYLTLSKEQLAEATRRSELQLVDVRDSAFSKFALSEHEPMQHPCNDLLGLAECQATD